MWQLAAAAGLAIGAVLYLGSDIIRWHGKFLSDEFNAIAAWASIYGLVISCLGLFMSGYAAWGIRQLKTRFLAKARLPVLGKSLQKNAAALSDMAEQAPIPQQEKTALFSSITANLNAVQRHAPAQIRKSQKETRRTFEQLTREANNTPANAMGKLASFWETYEKIELLKNEIDHYLADEKWGN